MTMCINRRAFGHGGFLMTTSMTTSMTTTKRERMISDGIEGQLLEGANTRKVMSPAMTRLAADARKDTTRKDGLLDL